MNTTTTIRPTVIVTDSDRPIGICPNGHLGLASDVCAVCGRRPSTMTSDGVLAVLAERFEDAVADVAAALETGDIEDFADLMALCPSSIDGLASNPVQGVALNDVAGVDIEDEVEVLAWWDVTDPEDGSLVFAVEAAATITTP